MTFWRNQCGRTDRRPAENTVTAAVKNTTVNIKDGNGNNASGSSERPRRELQR